MAEEQAKLESPPDAVPVNPQSAHIMRQLFHALMQAGNNYRAAVFDLVCEHKLNPNDYSYHVEQGAFIRNGVAIELPKGDGPKANLVKMAAKGRRKHVGSNQQ